MIFFWAAMTIVFAACEDKNKPSKGSTNDSDSTTESISSGESTDSLFNKIYSRLVITGDMLPDGQCDIDVADEGFTSFLRMMFELQESPCDHLYWIWPDVGISELTKNSVTDSNPCIYGFFRRLYYNISMCNSYLTRTESQKDLATERAEIRFLRAYFYYYLLDMYGNVPIVTDNTPFQKTPQSTRQQVYNFVASELLAAEADLSEAGQKPDYYRVDKAAAWLLLSRLYLNGNVYAGANDFDQAAKYASKVINSSYDLATTYKWLFMGDNDKRSNANDAWKEMIFPARQEGASTASWGGSIFLIASMADSSLPPVGITDGWRCYISRAQLVDLFCSNPDNYAGTADELTQRLGDDRALFCNSYNGNTWQYGTLSTGNFNGGWAIQKWSNLMADANYVQSDAQWPDTDIPLMRKAEAYLNYAEAVLRGGAAVNGLTALQAVNIIRTRAHATEKSTITLDDILDERGRELYAEGYRRTDLIRFNKFGGNTGYTWEMKGGTAFPEYMNLYPIPAELLQTMKDGRQNEGY